MRAATDRLIQRAIDPYDAEASELRIKYAEVPFARRHNSFRDLFPSSPSDVLDVGAGTGIDARGFAELGHRVVAAEPARGMRAVAVADNDHPGVLWIDDRLPELAAVKALDRQFDFILVSAAFMHLPPEAQTDGMAGLAALAKSGGVVTVSLRHGPAPEGRLMHEVSGGHAAQLADDAGLDVIRCEDKPDRLKRPGVSWTMMCFVKRG